MKQLTSLKLQQKYEIIQILAHQESGNDLTFCRDKSVRRYFNNQNIKFKEYQNNGVIRGLKNRKTWDKRWVSFMSTPIKDYEFTPDLFFNDSNTISTFLGLKEKYNSISREYIPGEKNAKKQLSIFLKEKVEEYFYHISLPEKSRYHTSRLSPILLTGTFLSVKFGKLAKNKKNINNKKSVNQYMAGLKWHCHFIQKLEMQPDLEFRNLNTAFYRSLENKKKQNLHQGVGARADWLSYHRCCNEMCHRNWFLNFRLRSTVVSFLTHHLWQPWQAGAHFLARQFIDFEPGIHYPQFQMQANNRDKYD